MICNSEAVRPQKFKTFSALGPGPNFTISVQKYHIVDNYPLPHYKSFGSNLQD